MNATRKTRTGWWQLMAVGLLMPVLSFCSDGPGVAPAAATAADVGPGSTAAPAAAPAAAIVYINEVLAHTDEPQVDSVELFNPGAAPVDLAGWCLSDDEDKPDKFCISRATIPSGGYRVYTAADFSFGLSEFGESLYLYAPAAGDLQQVDQAEFGVSPNGVSLGRYATSTGAVDFPLQSALSLGAANSGPFVPAVVIGEIMYQPAQGPEYLVLTNRSSQPAPLYDKSYPQNRWRVAGIGNNNGEYVLPPQITLQAGESVVLTTDPAAFAATYPARTLRIFGPFSGKLDNGGERVALQAPQPPEADGDVAFVDVDVVRYGVGSPWPAAGASGKPLLRINPQGYGNDAANWRIGGDATVAFKPTLMLPFVMR
jgi:hypothetical protein